MVVVVVVGCLSRKPVSIVISFTKCCVLANVLFVVKEVAGGRVCKQEIS